NGTGADTFLAASVTHSGDGSDVAHQLTITGTLAQVNAALAHVQYTPNGEFEGTDHVHFSATSSEDFGVSTSASAAETSNTITVNGTADTPVISTPDAVTTTEDVATLLSNLSVSSTDGGNDDADNFTATLHVEAGKLALVNGTGADTFVASSVSHSGDGHDSAHALTIAGTLSQVNAALAHVQYTPNGEFEGTDHVHFGATSSEDFGVSTSGSAAETSNTITV